MHQAVIAATGLYTPPHSLSNAELVQTFNAYVERFNAANAEAIAAGERAAVAIGRMLAGEDQSFWRGYHDAGASFDPDADPVPWSRERLQTIPLEKRRQNFAEVEQPWNEATAVRQAKRCLRCDYGKQTCDHEG